MTILIRAAFLSFILSFFSLTHAAVTEAPAIKLPAMNGEFDLDSLRGKVVYLDFWASWCKPCVKSFPWMQKLQDQYRDQGLEIVAVSLDQEEKLAYDFVKKMGVSLTVAFDTSGDVAEAYQVIGVPSSYLIGRDGMIYASHTGFRDKDKSRLELAIQQLLKQ